MGMRDSLAFFFFFFFFFFCACAGQGEKNTKRTSGRCQDEVTENVEGRPHLFFFGLNLEQVLGYRKCGEKIALFLAV